MLRRPPRSTRTDTLFPYTTLFRSGGGLMHARDLLGDAPVLVVNSDNLWIDGPTDAIRELAAGRSEEHTSELQSLMRISYAVFCLKKKKTTVYDTIHSTRSDTHICKLQMISV